MERFEIFVPSEPVAQGRPRFSTSSGYARAYDPAKSHDAKLMLAHLAMEAMEGQERMQGPLRLTLRVTKQPPRSWSRRKASEAIGRGITSRPDTDNYIKLVLDALNGIVFTDDSQVVYISASKRYSQKVGTYIEITEDKV